MEGMTPALQDGIHMVYAHAHSLNMCVCEDKETNGAQFTAPLTS